MKRTMHFLRAAAFSGMFLLPAMLSAQNAENGVPAEWGNKLPWRAWAHVSTLPAMQDADKLTDGDLTTAARMTKGGEAGAEYTFSFPEALDVTMFRFAQTGNGATKYQLLADTEGKGICSEVIALREDPKAIKREFIEIPVNRKVFGLKFVAIAGEIGYRSMFPMLSEVEIYAKEKIKADLPKTFGPLVQTAQYKQVPPFTKRNIDIRICTDQWNYGLASWDPKKVALKDYPGYRNLVDSLKALDANSVRFFDESLCGQKKLPFPSSLVPAEYTLDWMKPLTQALAKDGLKLYYFTHAWKPPFQERDNMAPSPWCRWDYPYHQSDTVFGLNKNYKRAYPCVLTDDDYRVKWTQMMREALQNGASGVYLMPDEWFFKGHNLARANCKGCTEEFKKMFGYDAMPKPEVALKADKDGYIGAPPSIDSEQYRKWKLYEYTKMAELFARVAADLRKEFPKAQLITNDNQAIVDISSARLEHTIASDIVGKTVQDADFAQIYCAGNVVPATGDFIAFTKRFEASAGKDKLLSSAGWGGANVMAPMDTYNRILSEVMLGAKIVEIYRHNYMFFSNSVSVYKKIFRMIRLLEVWNIDKTFVPDTVCMLFSRASEDWYYTKVSAMMSPDKKGETVNFYLHLADETINRRVASEGADDLQRFLAQDRVRGYGARQTMETLLSVNAVPYKVAYTERPDNMKNLKRFKLLVMPFTYSLSRDAFEEIKAAVEAGTKLIIFEQLAPTNEFGTPYEKPLLEELIGKPGVTYVKESLAETAADARKQNEYLKLIRTAIKDEGYFYDNNGFPVSCVVKVMPDNGGYILYLGNFMPYGKPKWGDSAVARVTLGLPGTGEYRMETYSSDSNELNVNKIKGHEKISAEDLKKFTVSVLPQEVQLIRIYR